MDNMQPSLKFSNDFSPGAVSEAVPAPDRPVLETEFTPLNETTYNDNMRKDRLTSLTESYNAAGRILYAYDQYNLLMMTGKLRAYIAAIRWMRGSYGSGFVLHFLFAC